jgi:hypothetical protein
MELLGAGCNGTPRQLLKKNSPAFLRSLGPAFIRLTTLRVKVRALRSLGFLA